MAGNTTENTVVHNALLSQRTVPCTTENKLLICKRPQIVRETFKVENKVRMSPS